MTKMPFELDNEYELDDELYSNICSMEQYMELDEVEDYSQERYDELLPLALAYEPNKVKILNMLRTGDKKYTIKDLNSIMFKMGYIPELSTSIEVKYIKKILSKSFTVDTFLNYRAGYLAEIRGN